MYISQCCQRYKLNKAEDISLHPAVCLFVHVHVHVYVAGQNEIQVKMILTYM